MDAPWAYRAYRAYLHQAYFHRAYVLEKYVDENRMIKI